MCHHCQSWEDRNWATSGSSGPGASSARISTLLQGRKSPSSLCTHGHRHLLMQHHRRKEMRSGEGHIPDMAGATGPLQAKDKYRAGDRRREAQEAAHALQEEAECQQEQRDCATCTPPPHHVHPERAVLRGARHLCPPELSQQNRHRDATQQGWVTLAPHPQQSPSPGGSFLLYQTGSPATKMRL